MRYANDLKKLGAMVKHVGSGARRLSWNVRRTTPDPIRKTAEARVAKMIAESEPFRRMPTKEHERVRQEIQKEEATQRRLTASVARHQLEPHVRVLDEEYRGFVARCRRDTAADFPHALDGLDPAGMLAYHLLMETVRPAIEQASAAHLLQRYQDALATPDSARSLIEATLIEARIERGGLAETAEQLPLVKRLREFYAGVQELRVPVEQLGDVPDTIAFAYQQLRNADLVQVRAIDIDQPANAPAKAAFESEAQEFADALAAAAGDE